jgi:hypothetical protein
MRGVALAAVGERGTVVDSVEIAVVIGIGVVGIGSQGEFARVRESVVIGVSPGMHEAHRPGHVMEQEVVHEPPDTGPSVDVDEAKLHWIVEPSSIRSEYCFCAYPPCTRSASR